MKASVIIPTFMRDDLLEKNCLPMIARQRKDFDELEIVVVDDTEGSDRTKAICKAFDATYICECKPSHDWRIPDHAFNLGVDVCKHENVILTEPEILQLPDCLKTTVEIVENDEWAYAYCQGKKDKYNVWNGDYEHPELQGNFPGHYTGFLTGFRKSHYQAIGGFDEEYTGRGKDDIDMMERLIAYGLHYVIVPNVKIIHLWHEPNMANHFEKPLNRELYIEKRKGSIYRNGTQPKEQREHGDKA